MKKNIALATAIVGGSFIVVMILLALWQIFPAFASPQCCYYESTPPTNALVSSTTGYPYGYITHQPSTTAGDLFIDSDSALRWSSTSTKSYLINMSGATLASGFTESAAVSTIQTGAGSWRSLLSNVSDVPALSSSTTTTYGPSQAASGCGSGSTDTRNVVAWCSDSWFDSHGGSAATAFAYLSPSWSSAGTGIQTSLSEVDIALHAGFFTGGWTSSDLDRTIRHEFGHFYGLGDLYRINGTGCSFDPGGDFDQLMCSTASTQGWGDKAGAVFLYPKRYSTSLSVTNIVSGSDSATAAIPSSGSNPDILFVYADYNSGAPQSVIKVKPYWDISSSTGSGTSGTVSTLRTESYQVFDVGATIESVGGSSNPDLVLTYSRTLLSNTYTYYMVFFDISYSGGALTWSSTYGPTPVTGSGNDKGTDVLVYDMTGDGSKDLVVMNSRYDGANYKLYWYWGTISSNGSVSSWSSSPDNNTISVKSSEDIGFSKPTSANNRIVTISYKDGSYMRQHDLYLSSSGTVGTNKIIEKYAPIYSISGTLEGIGAGDAYNLGGSSSYKEQIFSWVDGTTVYYTIEWEGRLNSHP